MVRVSADDLVRPNQFLVRLEDLAAGSRRSNGSRARAAEGKPPNAHPPASARIPSAIVDVVIAVVAGLSTWYLVRPQPLLFQNEVDAIP